MAAYLNKVMLIGNLTADPDVRTTPRGNTVAELRLAINRTTFGSNEGERREEVTYLDVTCWGRQAEVAGQYLAKGRPVFIEGRLQMDSWDDKQTGQKRTKIRVVAEYMQLLGSRDGGQQQGGGNYGGGSYQQRSNNYGGNNYGGQQGGGNYGGGYPQQQRPQYQQQPQQRPQQQAPMPPMEDEDDIPF